MQDKSNSSERLQARGDIWHMSSRPPANFDPKIVIYRRLVVPAGEEPYYLDPDLPTIYNGGKFRRLIRAIAGGTYRPNSPDRPEEILLDITVRKDAYIILEAVDKNGRRLPFKNPGIYLSKYKGQSYPANFCGALDYIDDDGDIHERWRPGCHIVMFCAVFINGTEEDPYIQSLAYDVDTGGDRALEQALALIDPDIRYPGKSIDGEEVGGN